MQVVLEFWTSSAASLNATFPPPVLKPTTQEGGLLFPSCEASRALAPCRNMDLHRATQAP